MSRLENIKTIAVFMSARTPTSSNQEEICDASRAVGTLLAENNIKMMYGAGSVGQMGIVAQAALDADGKVDGAITQLLLGKEGALPGVGGNPEGGPIVVESMHDRKKIMTEQADAFIVLWGGGGTMDELFGVFTERQLKVSERVYGVAAKPIVLVNTCRWADKLLEWVQEMAKQGSISAEDLNIIQVVKDHSQIMQALAEPTYGTDWHTKNKEPVKRNAAHTLAGQQKLGDKTHKPRNHRTHSGQTRQPNT